MIRTLLRAPRGTEILADGARVIGALGVVVAVTARGPQDAVSIALTTVATLIPRLLGVRPAVDIAFVVTAHVASWSGVLGLYRSIPGWDLLVHFLLNGLVAALGLVLLLQLRVLPAPDEVRHPRAMTIVVATSLGLSFGVLWEFLEWFVKTFVDGGTQVGYGDTLLDLLAGGLGAFVAGCAMPFIAGDSRAAPRDAEDRAALA